GLFQDFSGEVGPLVVFTTPDINTPGTKFILDDHDSNGGYTVCDDAMWYFCPVHGFQLSLRCSYRCTVFTRGYDTTVKACASCDVRDKTTLHDFTHPSIIAAYTAARQARFEHKDNLRREIDIKLERLQQLQQSNAKKASSTSMTEEEKT